MTDSNDAKRKAKTAHRFINVALPQQTIDDLHALKTSMGAKSQTELLIKLVAIMKAIESAARAT